MTRSIAGIFRRGGSPDRSRLAAALAPHESICFADGPLALAHSGPAPASSDPLCLLAGHIDNAEALALELGIGTGRPAEQVLVAAYRMWGEELLPRLRGDFALMLWDRERERGWIARDQLGVRCLYLYCSAGTTYFATEMRELLAILPRRPAPDRAGVAHWVSATVRAGPGTLYEGVSRLAPAGVLMLGEDEARERCYWQPRFSEPQEIPAQESAELVGDAIRRAVEVRIAPERSAGVLMSGGLDSSSVAAFASQIAPGRVQALCAIFPEHPAVDESALIGTLRADLHLPGVNAEVRTGGLLASGLESLAAWQLPLLSWGDFWTLPLLRAAARSGVGVVLGGDGGDELFATRAYLLADHLRAGDPCAALRLAHELPGAGDRPSRRRLLSVAGTLSLTGAAPLGLHRALHQAGRRRSLPGWLGARARSELLGCSDELAWKRLDGPRWWAHAAHGLSCGVQDTGIFELHRHRAALAGVQARHPLFDLDLLELILRQPPLRSFDRHRNRPLLRAATAGMLPDAVRLRRQKARFDSLILDTLAGPDAAAVSRLLCAPGSELADYIDIAAARESLLRGSGARSRDPFAWMQHVWRLSTAECWLRSQADPQLRQLAGTLAPSGARVRLEAVGARGPAVRRARRLASEHLRGARLAAARS